MHTDCILTKERARQYRQETGWVRDGDVFRVSHPAQSTCELAPKPDTPIGRRRRCFDWSKRQLLFVAVLMPTRWRPKMLWRSQLLSPPPPPGYVCLMNPHHPLRSRSVRDNHSFVRSFVRSFLNACIPHPPTHFVRVLFVIIIHSFVRSFLHASLTQAFVVYRAVCSPFFAKLASPKR
jgi:hypothetical protein